MDKKKILTIIGVIAFVIIIILSIVIKPVNSGSDSTSKKLTNDPTTIMNNAQAESAKVEDSEKGEFNQINVDTYLAFKAGEEPKIVLVARPTCSYCQIAEPIVQKIIHDYNVEVNYLNTDNFEGEDQSNFVKSDDMFSEGFGTPMLLLVQNGKIVDSIDGLTDTAHYVEFMKKHNFIQ